MKKLRIIGLVMMGCLLMTGTVYAVTDDKCRLEYGMSSAESGHVGTSKTGVFTTQTDADSIGSSYTFCYCAWTGRPYTIENKFETPRGMTVKNTEYQSKNSTFYTRVTSSAGDRTRATGWVKAI